MRLSVFIVTCLVPFLAFTQDSSHMMTQADEYFKLGRFTESGSLYSELTQLHPTNADLWFNLSRCQMEIKKFRHAKRSIETALDLRPDDVQFQTLSAKLHFETGYSMKAKQMLQKILRNNPSNHEARITLAEILAEDQLYKECKKHLDILRKKAPGEADFWKLSAEVAMKLKNYEKSILHFTKAIEIDPKRAEFYYLRGMAYALLENLVSASKDHQTAIGLAGKYAFAKYNYTRKYINKMEPQYYTCPIPEGQLMLERGLLMIFPAAFFMQWSRFMVEDQPWQKIGFVGQRMKPYMINNKEAIRYLKKYKIRRLIGIIQLAAICPAAFATLFVHDPYLNFGRTSTIIYSVYLASYGMGYITLLPLSRHALKKSVCAYNACSP